MAKRSRIVPLYLAGAVQSLYQAWLALEGTHDREFCSRVRKGAGADIGASGATSQPPSDLLSCFLLAAAVVEVAQFAVDGRGVEAVAGEVAYNRAREGEADHAMQR